MNYKTKKFSKNYDTYTEWLACNTNYSEYKKRIVRLHGMYPDANLAQLRGHAGKKEQTLSEKQALPMYKRDRNALSPSEKDTMENALKVLSLVRRGKKSFNQASKEVGLSKETILKYTNAFKKEGNHWKAKRFDKINRIMDIYENGKIVSIDTKDSRVASLIGKYGNAVKKYLNTGDASDLLKFKGKTIKDANGNLHIFETDLEVLEVINEGIEEPEFYDHYKI